MCTHMHTQSVFDSTLVFGNDGNDNNITSVYPSRPTQILKILFDNLVNALRCVEQTKQAITGGCRAQTFIHSDVSDVVTAINSPPLNNQSNLLM